MGVHPLTIRESLICEPSYLLKHSTFGNLCCLCHSSAEVCGWWATLSSSCLDVGERASGCSSQATQPSCNPEMDELGAFPSPPRTVCQWENSISCVFGRAGPPGTMQSLPGPEPRLVGSRPWLPAEFVWESTACPPRPLGSSGADLGQPAAPAQHMCACDTWPCLQGPRGILHVPALCH